MTMPSRAQDWLKQAKRDFSHAEADLKSGYYEWSCFSAQQAAEKAVKAICQLQNGEAWGHSITGILKKLVERFPEFDPLIKNAMNLDKLYIPSRYPNGFDSGTPEDYFTEEDARKAIEDARIIIAFCESRFSG
jgi:HEPN domain-containing protein